MYHTTRPMIFALAAATALATAIPALADGPILLTVSGEVVNTNRGPSNPDTDKLFAFNDVTFDRAMVFDADALAALPQIEIATDFPKGGPTVTFTGPTLADVLAAAGADGDKVTIRAMDGYAVEVPTEDMLGSGAVLALARDGKAFGIGDFGPTQVVFPRAERPDLTDMPDDWWVWQIYHIVVE
jgi:hypothetical protein